MLAGTLCSPQPEENTLAMRHFLQSWCLAFFSFARCDSTPAGQTSRAVAEPPPVVARLQAGRFRVGSNEGDESVVSKEVRFSEPFLVVPIVVATPIHFDTHPDVFSVTVANATVSGFRLMIHRTDVPVSGWGLDLDVDWIAVDYGGGMAKLLGGP